MAAKGWWNVSWTQGIRRILLLSAVMLSLLAAATVVVVVVTVAAAHNRRRPLGIALMVKDDRHQIQRLVEEWRMQGREESMRWWQPSLSSGSGSGGSGGDLNNKKRQLIGSWPPTCRAKCSGCTPCQAVHVAIQPGRSSPLEYYPEAWRCKCGKRLFMP